jgi:hypothetical protein
MYYPGTCLRKTTKVSIDGLWAKKQIPNMKQMYLDQNIRFSYITGKEKYYKNWDFSK